MELILLERIQNLGDLGERVSVKPGYGRNFLIPTGKAIRATKENIAYFTNVRAELEIKAEQSLATAKETKQALEALKVISVAVRAGAEGKLYGSVGPAEIASAIAAHGVNVARRHISMPNGPIRHVGEHVQKIILHAEVNAEVTVLIEAETEN